MLKQGENCCADATNALPIWTRLHTRAAPYSVSTPARSRRATSTALAGPAGQMDGGAHPSKTTNGEPNQGLGKSTGFGRAVSAYPTNTPIDYPLALPATMSTPASATHAPALLMIAIWSSFSECAAVPHRHAHARLGYTVKAAAHVVEGDMQRNATWFVAPQPIPSPHGPSSNTGYGPAIRA
jgi:hypothetical protein